MGKRTILVVGAGAAGYFAALAARGTNPSAEIVIVEAGARPLRKVKISGGGRCNVTHHCFDPSELVKNYPRGGRELRSAFSRFQPRDTVEWFRVRGVALKTEPDGRMFPITDSSETIIDCLERCRKEANIALRLNTKLTDLTLDQSGNFTATLVAKKTGPGKEPFSAVILTAGSNSNVYKIAEQLGHTITPCVPSLFTFQISDTRLEGLAGISVSHAQLELRFEGKKSFQQSGPVLITHWGLSGPAVIKLSAWAAKELFYAKYRAQLTVNWLGVKNEAEVLKQLQDFQTKSPRKSIYKHNPFLLQQRLWQSFASFAGITDTDVWGQLKKEQRRALLEQLLRGNFEINGKGVFKEEFVTCGGIALKEVDFKFMQSKIKKNLYFAGELLDIDGITGGFNFQSAWTTGWIAGSSAVDRSA